MSDVRIDGNAIKVGDSIVGEITENGLELNLAWLRLADSGLILYGDKHDSRRVLINRPAGGKKVEPEVL
jgi:hypothetical protein